MLLDRPFFMEDESWYEFDSNKEKYVLKDNAPPEAEKSYDEFYKELIDYDATK